MKLKSIALLWGTVVILLVALPAIAQHAQHEDTAYITGLAHKFDDTLAKDTTAALHIAEDMVRIATRLNYKEGIANGYCKIARYYDNRQNTPKQMEYLKKALAVARENNLKLFKARALNNLSVISNQSMEYATAITYLNEALDIFRDLHDTLGMAQSYVNISSCFMNSKNYEQGVKYSNIAAAIFKQLHKMNAVAITYCNMALMYDGMKKTAECLLYADTAISIFKSLGDTDYLSVPYGIYGNYYTEKKEYDSAIYYFSKNLAIASHTGDKREQAFASVNLGICYKELGKYNLAEQYYQTTLKLAHEANYRAMYYQAPYMLALLYDTMHNYKKEAEYYKIAYANRDSFVNEDRQKEMAEMTARFDNKELENENKLLEKDHDIQEAKLQKKNLLIYSSFGASILLLIIGMQVVRHNKLKANRRLLQVEQKQLLAQMNPHFIFNCLNSIQQFVVQNDTLNANRYLADFAMLMRQTLDNSKDSTITLHRELDYLENYLSFESMRFEDKFQYTLTCAEDIDTDSVEIPSMIVQPFVENAIRHGLYNLQGRIGKLAISFYIKEYNLICEVDDNGIGMEEAEKIKGQRLIKYQSHGMDITRQRLELVSKATSSDYKIIVVNKMDMDQKPAGTTIIIKFPLDL